MYQDIYFRYWFILYMGLTTLYMFNIKWNAYLQAVLNTELLHLRNLYDSAFILQTKFGTPEGRDPVAIRMNGMGKGMIWVNGQSIGRHWMSYLSPLGQPTQSE